MLVASYSEIITKKVTSSIVRQNLLKCIIICVGRVLPVLNSESAREEYCVCGGC